jgi:hypothetical protein
MARPETNEEKREGAKRGTGEPESDKDELRGAGAYKRATETS